MTTSLRLDRRRFAELFGIGVLLSTETLLAGEDVASDLRQLLSEEEIRSLPTKWTKLETGTSLSYKREVKFNGEWRFAGFTLPIRKATNQAVKPRKNYLDPRVVPKEIRGFEVTVSASADDSDVQDFRPPSNLPDVDLRARHGLPPSEWIRSRNAKQLSRWLRTLDIPYFGVEQITFWDHLVRHHKFKPKLISGLSSNELAMLHSAAHYGY